MGNHLRRGCVPKPAAHVPGVSVAEQDTELGISNIAYPGLPRNHIDRYCRAGDEPAAFDGDLDGVFSPGHPDELIDLVRDRVVHRQAVNV